MEDSVKKIVVEVRKKINVPLEAKMLKGKPYLFRSTSRYDRVTEKAVNVSEYIGCITKDEITKSGKHTRSIYEYGNSALVSSLSV